MFAPVKENRVDADGIRVGNDGLKHSAAHRPNLLLLPGQKAKQPKPVAFVSAATHMNRNTQNPARTAPEQYRIDGMSMLAHDVEDPLMAILGCSDILIEGAKNRGSALEEDYLRRLRSKALTIRSLVANHMNMTRIESGTLTLECTPLSINELLSRMVRQYSSEAAQQQIHLVSQLQDKLPVIEGDPSALERVFSNLLANALKFTPEGGQVNLESSRQNEEVWVIIADTGGGISKGELEKIFDTSDQLRVSRKREGRSLGLFIVKTLVEAQGGRISVESTVGKGTRFTVSLPIAQGEPQASETESSEATF